MHGVDVDVSQNDEQENRHTRKVTATLTTLRRYLSSDVSKFVKEVTLRLRLSLTAKVSQKPPSANCTIELHDTEQM